MSARDRRLREAARERDRQQSDDTQESASFIADRLGGGDDDSSGGGDDDGSRDVRPGRGTEPSVVDRDPSPEPEPEPEPEPDTTPTPSPEPDPEPEPDRDDDRSISERIGDLQPGEVLRAGGSGGRGEPDVEVVSRGENIRDVREARLLAATDLTRAEL
ncbi:hypothetical protein, partial [Pontimonas sp.]|uniref:hypothetical protein n=1 Tax=Pontimonas sp. TaxID=2304492 RepID=UPI00286FC951